MADTTSTIPFVTVPFADADSSKVASLDFLKSGVTPDMTIPTKNGGMKFSRNQLNGIGYFATLGAYLDRIGYPYGKVKDTGEDFGGYPKGAILISEDNDFVREYVSQEDNNIYPLPSEGAEGTYEGDEHWKPAIPSVVDFFPDFTIYTQKASVPNVRGVGNYGHVVDEDGWYQLMCQFTGEDWPQSATLDNALYKAGCSVRLGFQELCRLDGRNSVMMKLSEDGKAVPVSSATVPLKKGSLIGLYYNLSDEQGYAVRLVINRWGASTL